MAKSKFEIGNIYFSNKKLYIAISKHKVIRPDESGKFQVYTVDRVGINSKKPDFKQPKKEIQIKNLCRVWKITPSQLDEEVNKYFAPDAEAKKRARSAKKTYVSVKFSQSNDEDED